MQHIAQVHLRQPRLVPFVTFMRCVKTLEWMELVFAASAYITLYEISILPK